MPDSNVTNFLFAVWGESFIDKFAALTMATLLSPGNLPALARSHRLHLMFYTDRESAGYLRDRTIPLTAFASLSITAFEDTMVDGRNAADSAAALSGPAVKHELERQVTFHAIDAVLDRREGDTLFIIPSDLVASDGSIARAQAILDRGADAVAPPVLRLAGEAPMWTESQLRAGIDHLAICQSLPESFQHITRDCIATSPNFTQYPASILWPVGEEGYVCRTFFPLTLAFKPRAGCRRYESSIDYDFLLNLIADPGEIHVPASSAEICVLKVSNETYMRHAPKPRQLRGAALAHFLLTETNKAHRGLIGQPFRLLRRAGGELDEAAWTHTETQSGQFLDSAYAALDQIVEQVPKDTPGLTQSVKSHFGGLADYLSPMRRPGIG